MPIRMSGLRSSAVLKYLFVQDMGQLRAAHRKAVDCLTLALPHLDPPGERVLIPYQGKHLAGTLRLPRGIKRPPLVLMTMGLDSTKEELGTFELTFLERGIATLAFDGPGQGEAEYDLPIRADYENVVGPVIDWLATRVDVDGERLGIWGVSLGGYYAPRAAAFEKRIKAAIANSGPYAWGALWDALPGLTRAAFVTSAATARATRKRASARRRFAGRDRRMDRMPALHHGGRARSAVPAAGRPPARREARGPVELLVIEDGNHVAHNRFYTYRGKSADWMARQLGA